MNFWWWFLSIYLVTGTCFALGFSWSLRRHYREHPGMSAPLRRKMWTFVVSLIVVWPAIAVRSLLLELPIR